MYQAYSRSEKWKSFVKWTALKYCFVPFLLFFFFLWSDCGEISGVALRAFLRPWLKGVPVLMFYILMVDLVIRLFVALYRVLRNSTLTEEEKQRAFRKRSATVAMIVTVWLLSVSFIVGSGKRPAYCGGKQNQEAVVK